MNLDGWCLSSSYDCLASLKIDRIIDTLNECSFGAYVILKLILKNRVPFVKVGAVNVRCIAVAFSLYRAWTIRLHGTAISLADFPLFLPTRPMSPYEPCLLRFVTILTFSKFWWKIYSSREEVIFHCTNRRVFVDHFLMSIFRSLYE